MDKTLAVARYLFVESFRNWLFIALVLISALVIAGNFALDFFSQGIQDRIFFDFSSSLAAVLGAFLSIYLVTTQVRGEIDSRLACFSLTCEISRGQYLAGKILGAFLFAAGNVLILTAEIFLVIYFNSGTVSYLCLIYFYVLLLKLSVLCSLTALFAVFCSGVITPSMAFFLYVVGHCNSYIHLVASKNPGTALSLVDFAVTYMVPNFRFFTVEHVATESFSGAASYIASLSAYAASLDFLIIFAAMAIFAKKDI